MEKIISQGRFQSYVQARLDEARATVNPYSYGLRRTTVFLSHKHDELDDLKHVIGFFQEKYGVKVYIDSRDPTMPKQTTAETASNLKQRIRQCDKFVLLATNGAINSKWCNWELGYGDAQKYRNHIAILPMKPQGSSDSSYRGTEYLSLYPYIRYEDGTERKEDGTIIPSGYYVVTTDNGKTYYQTLGEWFSKR